MARDMTMSDDVAFESLCLMLNRDPKSTSWEAVVGDVIKLTEFMSLMTSFSTMHHLPSDLLKRMCDVIA